MNNLSSLLLLLFMSANYSSCAQKNNSISQAADAVEKSQNDLSKYKQATFAAGCFWCEEAVFESVKGVKEAVSGYAGGESKNPTYEEVETGTTGHAETVNVYYDSSMVDYRALLKVYFAAEDPTQVNGQGPDHGTQYRSIIFYRNLKEKQLAENYISELNKSGKYSSKIAAQIVPFTVFWKAENYHQNYIAHNPDNPYVQHESIPRIKRFQSALPDLVKSDHSLLNE